MKVREVVTFLLTPESGASTEKVRIYWLSRHKPNKDQLTAWFLLHGKDMTATVEVFWVYHYLTRLEDWESLINDNYRDGFCYIVAPFSLIEALFDRGCRFGAIEMRQDICGEKAPWLLIKVVHYNDGQADYGNSPRFIETIEGRKGRIVLTRGRVTRYISSTQDSLIV